MYFNKKLKAFIYKVIIIILSQVVHITNFILVEVSTLASSCQDALNIKELPKGKTRQQTDDLM